MTLSPFARETTYPERNMPTPLLHVWEAPFPSNWTQIITFVATNEVHYAHWIYQISRNTYTYEHISRWNEHGEVRIATEFFHQRISSITWIVQKYVAHSLLEIPLWMFSNRDLRSCIFFHYGYPQKTILLIIMGMRNSLKN